MTEDTGVADGLTLVLEQAFDGDSLNRLRARVAAHAADSILPQQRRDDLVMAVHELAANAVRHGPGRGKVRVWRAGQTTIICEVSDDGPGDGGPAHRCPEDGGADYGGFPWPSKPGHGLWLVSQIADHCVVRADASGVRAVVSFCADPAGSIGQAGSAQSAESS